jgi:hypothetical protein
VEFHLFYFASRLTRTHHWKMKKIIFNFVDEVIFIVKYKYILMKLKLREVASLLA